MPEPLSGVDRRKPFFARCLAFAWRWAWAMGLALALLWALCWGIVPHWAQQQIEQQGTRTLGRVVQVEQVVFQPWSLSLIVRGLRIGKAGAASAAHDPQLTVEEIEVNAALQSLWWWAPVTDALRVKRPMLYLTHQGQGQFDVEDVIRRFSGGASKDAGTARMSLFNIQITDGGVEFSDAPKQLTHTLRKVQLDIPFLSNVGGKRDVATRPRLAFELNGAVFDSDAQTTPFAQDHRTEARLHIESLDVAPYLAYWPALWPVRLVQGRLALDMRLNFRQQTVPEVSVSGHLALSDWALDETSDTSADGPLLRWDKLALQIDTWQPLQSVLKIRTLKVDAPALHLRRDRAGEWNWARLQRTFAPSSLAAPSAAPEPVAAAAAASMALQQLQIAGGQLHWQDATTAPTAQLHFSRIDFQGKDLGWPTAQQATFEGQAHLEGASLSWQGTTDLKQAQAQLHWQDLSLKTAAPYLAQWLQPELSGQSEAQLHLDWRSADLSEPAKLVVKVPRLRVTDVVLGLPAKPDVSWSELTLTQLEVDVLARQAHVGQIAWLRPVLNVGRSASGRWMFEDWTPPTNGPVHATGDSHASQPWQWHMGPLQIEGAAVHWRDLVATRPVQMDLLDVNLRTGPWQPLAKAPQMTPLKFDMRTGGGAHASARMGFEGAFKAPAGAQSAAPASPLQVKGQLQLVRWPLHPLNAYWADTVNFDLQNAELSYAGGLDLAWPDAGMDLGLQGQLSVDNLHTTGQADGQDVVGIQALSIRGLDLVLRAGSLVHLASAETEFKDFFARVAINAAGQLNLQHLFKPVAKAPAVSPVDAVAPRVALGPIVGSNGRVLFSDDYIRPPYSVDVTQLSGSLGAVSNAFETPGQPLAAALNMRGRLADSASLQVSGHIHPLTRPVTLDVQGKVRDLELPQFSPYSRKHAGYGMERGKLSAEVNYRIDANAQLHASHQIILNQLRFGERSDAVDTPNLPVKLALALLADRDGVVDIQLPISGAIDDPDFKIGAIVWKLLVNLVGKAVVSPFSLVAGALSDADQLQQILFQPGLADLDASARQKLDTVAQLLRDKPALRLTIVGEAGETQAHETQALAAPGMAVRVVPPLSGGEPAARALAQARAQSVRAALLAAGVPEAQLFLGSPVWGEASRSTPLVPQASLRLSTD